MENDKYMSFVDSYINIDGSGKALTEFIDSIQDGKVKFVLSTKNSYSPKLPSVKETKKNLKKLM